MQIIPSNSRLCRAGLFALLLGLTLDCTAQWRVGISGGTNINRAQVASPIFSFYRVAPATGYQWGLRVEKDQANQWLTWVGNLHFIRKGDRTERTGQYAEYFAHLDRNYVQTDVGAMAAVGGYRWKVNVGASVYAAYWMGGATTQADGSLGQITTEELLASLDETVFTFDNLKRILFPTETVRARYEFDNSFAIDHRKDNRLDVGVTVRAGARYQLQRFTVLTEYSYSHGLRNLERFKDNFKINQLPEVNRTHRIEIGLLYTLNK